MSAPFELGRFLSRFAVTNAWVFYVAAAALVGYLLYMMIRPRRGERRGDLPREPEL